MRIKWIIVFLMVAVVSVVFYFYWPQLKHLPKVNTTVGKAIDSIGNDRILGWLRK